MTNPIRQLEPELKALLLSHLKENNQLEALDIIISEFTVANYSRRVDLATFCHNEWHAYEIKSIGDSLTRLEGQISTYLQYFDRVTVVANKKHIDKVTQIAPKSVGIWLAEERGQIKIIRKGRSKKVKTKPQLIEMMTVSELARLAKEQGVYKGSMKRKDLVNVASSLKVELLREGVFKSLAKKYAPTTNSFLEQTKHQQVSPKLVQSLSLYGNQTTQETLERMTMDEMLGALESLL
ncbi:sce7726 family protein [Vibrio europaeus]|uniref:sce7726 family protein n=1 Tax=Vibrio europaeus TaxID=300876 RepID=UPI00233F6532|nr:sce7726 family protein [Vibrio europaeus]MDC5869872.1 sce7726 family protein [Vibrio europaeus]